MADGLSIKLENGAKLDRILAKMQKRVATKLINQSLTKGAAEVRKNVKAEAPRAKKDTTGFKTSSRNVKKGQLRRAIKSGLRRKANLGKHTFLAAVFIQDTKGGAKPNSDGWFAPFVVNRHAPNAFGYKGGNNFIRTGINKSKSSFRKTVGTQLADKIAAQKQKEIDNKLR